MMILYALLGSHNIDEDFPTYDLVYVGLTIFIILFVLGVILSFILMVIASYFGSKAKSSFLFCIVLGAILGILPLLVLVGEDNIFSQVLTLSDVPFLGSGIILGMAVWREFKGEMKKGDQVPNLL
jgi:hypothetical protein